MALEIRPVQTIEEYHACEAIQRRVWAMPDDLEVVPLHLLLSVHKNDGLLLGAFEGKEMVGFVFGFLGLTKESKPKLCSHMMGVDPACQDVGVGRQLKVAQREWALAHGLDLVTWTYDPLESRNAFLNISKLGALCRNYVRDLYGPMSDGLNTGLPSDRFEVEWWLDSDRVCRRLAGESSPPPLESAVKSNMAGRGATGLLTPGPPMAVPPSAPRICFEIPADYQVIKSADPGLALEWRLAARSFFESSFAAGYRVIDFLSESAAGERHNHYFLESD